MWHYNMLIQRQSALAVTSLTLSSFSLPTLLFALSDERLAAPRFAEDLQKLSELMLVVGVAFWGRYAISPLCHLQHELEVPTP